MKKILVILACAAAVILLLVASALNKKSVPNQTDENGMYNIGQNYFRSESPLNENSVEGLAKKINFINETYLSSDMKVFYSLVPDKNYFVRDSGYPTLDYEKMVKILSSDLKNMEYIDLFGTLSLDDYLKTDPHWKQEELGDVIDALNEKMNFGGATESHFANEIPSFYGSYNDYLELPPEELVYLTNPATQAAIVKNYSQADFFGVYDLKKLESKTPYDLFLQGPSPLITIENPLLPEGRELLIFRDSYASGLTPLLISHYSKITLVDLRLISSQILSEYIDFTADDVLFLYSTMVANNSLMLK